MKEWSKDIGVLLEKQLLLKNVVASQDDKIFKLYLNDILNKRFCFLNTSSFNPLTSDMCSPSC